MTSTHPPTAKPHSQVAQSTVASITMDQSDLRQRMTWLKIVALFLALGFSALVAASVSGQAPKYKELKVEQLIDDNLNAVQREARGYAIARDPSSFPATRKAVVQRYFQQYVPAKITRSDSVHQINSIMSHVRSTVASATRSRTPASKEVMGWLYQGLKPIAVGDYHPAARVNAIQFISRMDAPPSSRGGIPRPYPLVLKELLALYLDQNNSDAIQATALMGIDRFVRHTPPAQIEAGGNTGAKQTLIDSMSKLLQDPPPSSRDEMVHAFLQRYAVNILTNLNADAALGKQLVSISTDEGKPNLIAFHSAAAIADLPTMAAGDVKTEDVLKIWSKRLMKAYQSEVSRLESMSTRIKAKTQPPDPDSFLKETSDPKDKASRMPMDMDMMMEDDMYDNMDMDMMMEDEMMSGPMMMGPMYGGTAAPAQPAELVASRKKLNFAIQQVLRGVTGTTQSIPTEDIETFEPTGGLMAATPPNSREPVRKWLQTLMDITTQLNDLQIGTERLFIKSLDEQVEMLVSLSEGKTVAPRPSVEDEFGFGDPLSGGAPAKPDDANPGDKAANPAPGSDPGLDDLLN